MKRIITISLAAILLLSALLSVSCANNEHTSTGDLDREWLDNLPELDFEGEEVMFVFAEGTDTFTERSIKIEETDGDSVNELIAARNTTIEQRLNVSIQSQKVSDNIFGLRDAINSSLSSASGEYDIIAGYQFYDIGLATQGYIVNLNEVGNPDSEYAEETNYIDIDADYWASNYIRSLTYGDALFWVTGDIALRYLGGMYCTFVNTRIYDDNLKQTYGDIYQIAKDGKWTLELLNKMADEVYLDQGTPDETDAEDRLGYAWEQNDPIDGLAFGAGVKFSQMYSDGSIDITIGDQRTIRFVEQLEKLLTSRYSLMVDDGNSANVMQQFASGNVAFTVNKIYQAEARLREMEDNYYVIPVPKLNEDQQEYVTGIHDGLTLFGIPYDAPNVSMSSAVLEALSAESLRTVTPTYYDSYLKFKYTRDENAAAMIDLMRSTTNTDFAAAWSAELDSIVHIFRTSYRSNIITSTLRAKAEATRTKLDDLLEKLDQLGQQ